MDSRQALTTPAGRPDRILLLGVARSGTSWLGRAMGCAPGVRYYHEPDNVDAESAAEQAGGRGFGPYPLVDGSAAEAAFAPLWDMVFAGRLPRMRGWRLQAGRAALRLPRPVRDPLVRQAAGVAARLPGGRQCTVVKSIYATFAVEWLLARYQPRVVAIQRNPLNVVSSWRQLDMPLFDLLHRPALRAHCNTCWGVEVSPRELSSLGRVAWAVGLLTGVLGDAVERHPEWLLLSHEELCTDPPARFREVFERVGLAWSAEVEEFLAARNRPGEGFAEVRVAGEQATRWRSRLSDAEVAEVGEVLALFPRQGWLRAPAGLAV